MPNGLIEFLTATWVEAGREEDGDKDVQQALDNSEINISTWRNFKKTSDRLWTKMPIFLTI
mgnify:CR=1 FL=1